MQWNIQLNVRRLSDLNSPSKFNPQYRLPTPMQNTPAPAKTCSPPARNAAHEPSIPSQGHTFTERASSCCAPFKVTPTPLLRSCYEVTGNTIPSLRYAARGAAVVRTDVERLAALSFLKNNIIWHVSRATIAGGAPMHGGFASLTPCMARQSNDG